jgi:O-antigen ligase
VACLGALLHQPLLLGVALLALTLQGIRRPKHILMLALILTPFTFPMSGAPLAPGEARYGLSDLLLLCALPAVLAQMFRARYRPRVGRQELPVLLFLSVCALSMAVNLREVSGSYRPYGIGFLRTAQVVGLLPLLYALFPWSEQEMRDLLRGFLIGLGVLACGALGVFWEQVQRADYVGLKALGVSKNPLGLALALCALLALSALLLSRAASADKQQNLAGTPVWSLYALIGISMAGLLGTLSRSAYIGFLFGLAALCLLTRNVRAFALMLAISVSGFLLLQQWVLKPNAARYVTSFAPERFNIHARLTQAEAARATFLARPILGDGLRTRKDHSPHNIEFELLAETGIVGTGLFLWVLVVQFRLFLYGRTRFTAQPYLHWFCLMLLVCSVTVLAHAHFDPFWRRGPLWIPWAGMGILIACLRASGQEEIGFIFYPAKKPES